MRPTIIEVNSRTITPPIRRGNRPEQLRSIKLRFLDPISTAISKRQERQLQLNRSWDDRSAFPKQEMGHTSRTFYRESLKSIYTMTRTDSGRSHQERAGVGTPCQRRVLASAASPVNTPPAGTVRGAAETARPGARAPAATAGDDSATDGTLTTQRCTDDRHLITLRLRPQHLLTSD